MKQRYPSPNRQIDRIIQIPQKKPFGSPSILQTPEGTLTDHLQNGVLIRIFNPTVRHPLLQWAAKFVQ